MSSRFVAQNIAHRAGSNAILPTVHPQVDRFKEPPDHGLLYDLLWADPAPNFENEPAPASGAAADSFLPNPARGCSYFFT